MDNCDWQAAAKRLAELIPLAPIPRDERLCIACSGGVDSVCATLLAWAHFPGLRERMTILHFDHRLRGADSVEDARFVESIARGLGIGYRGDVWDRASDAKINEATAREARLDFFDNAMRDLQCSYLVQGHHQNDIAESMLMALARGSEPDALLSPRPLSEFRPGCFALRPLLDLQKAEIVEACRAAGVPWREDATNAEDDFMRNRMRNQIIPSWQEVAERDVVAGCAQSQAYIHEAQQAVEFLFREVEPHISRQHFPRDLLSARNFPRAVWRKALRAWLALNDLGERVRRANFEAILDALHNDESFQLTLAPSVYLIFEGSELALASAPPAHTNGGYEGKITAESVRLGHDDAASAAEILSGKIPCDTQCYLALADADALIRVRPWRHGDRYQPLGAPGSRKLQDMFTDRKIPAAERKRLPVVTLDDDQILWVPGFPPADIFKIDAGTESALRLTYLPDKSTF